LNKALATPHDDGLLVGNFESRWPEFEQELTRILAMEAAALADFVETEADVLAGYNLSAEARKVLVTAVAGNGRITNVISSRAGRSISASGQVLNEPRNPRSEAIWEGAIHDLVACDLLKDKGYKGEVFGVTDRGYKVADVLQKQGEA
jgi:hypothetical protein